MRKMAEIGFSNDGKYFSTISHDGRLKIWDTETNVLKQEYTPDLHLSAPPSCLQWISIKNSETPKGKHPNENNETDCIALGTTNGKILIYSVPKAKVETILEDAKNSEIQIKNIKSIDWSRNCGLFSCNKDGVLYEWDLKNAVVRFKYNVAVDVKSKGNSVSAIKIVPHALKTPAKFLVTASWQIHVWRLMDGVATVVMNLGHSGSQNPLLNLAVLDERSWLILGSHNERLLSFWDVTITSQHQPQMNGQGVTPHKKQRKKSISEQPVTIQGPTYNFVLEDAPKIVDSSLRNVDGSVKVELLAATRSGVVHYYSHVLNGSSAKPIKPSVTIQMSTPDAKPLPLQCCKLLDDAQIILGYDITPTKIVYERCTPDTKSKTQVLIRGAVEEKNANKQTDEINKTRSDDSEQVTYVEAMGGVVRKRATPGAKIEVPMEARLENLALDTKARSKSAVNQNLTKLLVQGLHSKDKDLILTVLQNNDAAVAQRTISNLPADYVAPLLQELTEMATRKTTQCASVCTWLSALLRTHSALLLATMNTSTAADRLALLLATFTQRRSHLCQLLNLKGRLELTIVQRSPQVATETDADAVLEYNDTSSDDEDMQVLQNSDNESWGEVEADSGPDQD